jgi:hypothetical protein
VLIMCTILFPFFVGFFVFFFRQLMCLIDRVDFHELISCLSVIWFNVILVLFEN